MKLGTDVELLPLFEEAVVHIIGMKIANLSKDFGWIKACLGDYKHEFSSVSRRVSESQNAFLLNLQETKNADCVAILDHCVNMFVECLL